MKRTLLAAGLMLMPLTTYAQQVLDCSTGNCKYVDPTSAASHATSKATATANSRSQSTAQSGVATGNTINAPVTTTSQATGGQGGSSSVVVVNRVSSGYGGGGFRHRASSGGASDPSSGGSTPAGDPPAATDPGPALGSAQNPLTENVGGTTTIRNVPEIVAPNISGGNPCLVGVSGGGAGPGIGITLGFGYSDKGCDRRNNAALLSNMGLKDTAAELMCDDDHVREAMLRSGHPCQADRVMAQPVAQVDPAIIRHKQAGVAPVPAPVPPPITIVPTAVAGGVKPAWCDTTGPSEIKFHPECR